MEGYEEKPTVFDKEDGSILGRLAKAEDNAKKAREHQVELARAVGALWVLFALEVMAGVVYVAWRLLAWLF